MSAASDKQSRAKANGVALIAASRKAIVHATELSAHARAAHQSAQALLDYFQEVHPQAAAAKAPPPCPKCHRVDRVHPEDQSGSSAPWFLCERCGTQFTVPPRR
jgi:lysyl-tRNA synthetase class I